MRSYSDTAAIRLQRRAEEADGCLLFGGYITKDGYGKIGVGAASEGMVPAHIMAWELEHGPIPVGMQLDHICHDPAVCREGRACRHRRCILTAHLQLVTFEQQHALGRTHRYNSFKTHCKQGHEFTEENTYMNPSGSRACRACRRDWARNH